MKRIKLLVFSLFFSPSGLPINKKDIRRALTLLLVFSLLFFPSSSLTNELIITSKLENTGYYTEFGMDGSFEDRYSDALEEQVLSLLSQMEEMVNKNDKQDTEALIALYDQLVTKLNVILDHEKLLYVRFCQTPRNNNISNEYIRLSSFCTDAVTRQSQLYNKIYNGNISDTLYEEGDEDKTYWGDFAEITKERDELVTLYMQLNINSSSFNSESADYYHQIVSKNRLRADLKGYESYPAYADARIYGRDYSSAQISTFKSYVKEYMVPLANDLYDFVNKEASNSSRTELSLLIDYDISFTFMEEKLTPYYETLGSDFSEGFSAFTQSVFTAYDKNSYPAAFITYPQNQAICYFGPGCQSVSTYVHEQGHYLAFYFSECSHSSYDLSETQSQSNEWLYLAYLRQFYDAEIYEEITAYYLLDDLTTIILAACCDSFERAVYADDTLKPDDYDDLFVSCAKELGAYSFLKSYMGSYLTSYWHRNVVSNSMYYLSYAVSLIPSIELFLIAEEQGFDIAAERYRALCTVDGDAPFLESILDASLSSPFQAQIFEKIDKRFDI